MVRCPKWYSLNLPSPLVISKQSLPGNTHRYPFLKQILQLHWVTVVISGILIIYLKAPQWQLPWYGFSSGVDSDMLEGCLQEAKRMNEDENEFVDTSFQSEMEWYFILHIFFTKWNCWEPHKPPHLRSSWLPNLKSSNGRRQFSWNLSHADWSFSYHVVFTLFPRNQNWWRRFFAYELLVLQLAWDSIPRFKTSSIMKLNRNNNVKLVMQQEGIWSYIMKVIGKLERGKWIRANSARLKEKLYSSNNKISWLSGTVQTVSYIDYSEEVETILCLIGSTSLGRRGIHQLGLEICLLASVISSYADRESINNTSTGQEKTSFKYRFFIKLST